PAGRGHVQWGRRRPAADLAPGCQTLRPLYFLEWPRPGAGAWPTASSALVPKAGASAGVVCVFLTGFAGLTGCTGWAGWDLADAAFAALALALAACAFDFAAAAAVGFAGCGFLTGCTGCAGWATCAAA